MGSLQSHGAIYTWRQEDQSCRLQKRYDVDGTYKQAFQLRKQVV